MVELKDFSERKQDFKRKQSKRKKLKERFRDEELFRENEKGSRREAEFSPAAFVLLSLTIIHNGKWTVVD